MPKPVRKMQKNNALAQAAALPKIPPELLDQLVKGQMTAEAVEDAWRAFKKTLIRRALGAEMNHHLGYPAGAESPRARGTTGTSKAAAIKPIYKAASVEAAEAVLDTFAEGPWGQKFPTVVAAWRRAWSNVIPFIAFPPAVRKVIYTTNAIESERPTAQDPEDPRSFPQRRRGQQTDLARASQHQCKMESCGA